ncbi:hypothetical protein SAMN04488003_10685 [Loktanella fryxellensis]|uniref:Amine oxidase domain-containing protein n=1 Tax=Loktanella fryxellensis TaxID=245187 RepID=A0A1H8C6X4_9RHOB|nr:FAD-dependent oxidoreductase [Loktanella fryxellensis]SEM90815.1 hypothetical protein SAMN04488003_10685 [Loktanella fryxellensis]
MIPVVVIGAGMAGVACARRLADAGLAPVVLDKGRGIGGRVATRRADAMQFDHGAQYATAQGAGFGAVLERLSRDGVVATWDDGSGRAHRVGVPGMSALPKALAQGLDVRQGAQVRRVVRDGDGWHVDLGADSLQVARVVMTVPAPQVAGLLGADHPLVDAIRDVRMAPCLTLMAAVDAPAPFTVQRDDDDDLAWIAQDSGKPGRPGGTLWVAQASEAFSVAHLEEDAAGVTALMLPLLCDRLGVNVSAVTHAASHRWRYARTTQALGQRFLSQDDTLFVGGDWCLGARIEAAWDSGTAIGNAILQQR